MEAIPLKRQKAVYRQGGIKKVRDSQNHSGGSREVRLRYPERNWNPWFECVAGEREVTATAAMQRSIASYHIRPLPLQRPTINKGYPVEQTENNIMPHNESYEKCPSRP